jgi:uncharacterized membrane protein
MIFENLFGLIALVLGIVALSKISTLNREFARMKALVVQLSEKLEKTQIVPAADEPPPKPIMATKPIDVKTPEPVAAAAAAEVKITAPPEPIIHPQPKRDIEQNLASRWFVWIGGAAIAMGGLLFVKYAYENRIISPTFQIILALVLAAALVLAGEMLRRNMAKTKDENYVPAALSAAGLVVAFGAIYAAYALYNLVAPGAAFIGLGAVGLSALALSLRQGPLIGALGIAGSYLTPTMITASNPNAWGFFPYLLVIMLASFAVLRKRPWWWLGYASIAGSAMWSILWMHGPFVMGDVLPLGLFALVFGAVSFFSVAGVHSLDADKGGLFHPLKMSPSLQMGSVGAGVASLVLALLVFKSAHGTLALSLFALGMAALCALAWFKKGETSAGLAAALLTLFVFSNWPLLSFLQFGLEQNLQISTPIESTVQANRFLLWSLGAGALYMVFGLAGLFKKSSPLNWACLAASAPVLFGLVSYVLADGRLTNTAWSMLALAIAAIMVGVSFLRKPKLSDLTENLGAGLLCAAAALALLFAADLQFENVWLTITIAVLAFAAAVVTKILPVRLLGAISAGLGTFTAVRLFASRELWNDEFSLPWGQHWPLYGYGIPIILFWLASRLLKSFSPRSSTGLEAVSLGLAISLVSLELRVLIGGGVTVPNLTLLEASTHLLTWLGAAYGLAYRQNIYSSFVSLWGSRILLGVSCVGIVFANLLSLNPVATGDVVEGGAIINTLWLAYLAPVVLLALMAPKLAAIGLGKLRSVVGALALVLVITFVTLETKRLFQGPVLDVDFSSDAESYAMSAVWLALSVVLFIAGLKWNRATIRYAGLAVMVLALLKTFGYDLWQLGGLWQIASVMGIGFSLVGIGWLYTRFVRVADTVK